jgi:ABC-type multidrug transport system fused ATPase/permease subunit
MEGETILLYIYVATGCIVFTVLIILFNRWLAKRQVYKIASDFRRHNALSAETAKSAEELGYKFKSPGVGVYVADVFATTLGSTGSLTDKSIKEKVFEQLVAARIVLYTSSGKLYLSEENMLISARQYNLNLDKTRKALRTDIFAETLISNDVLSLSQSNVSSLSPQQHGPALRKVVVSKILPATFLGIGLILFIFSIRLGCEQAIQGEYGNGIATVIPGAILQVLFLAGVGLIVFAGIWFLVIKLKRL